jgi:hypothetical protein
MKSRERVLFAVWILLLGAIVVFAMVRSAKADEAGNRLPYENNFESSEVGAVPDDFLVLNGEFGIQTDGTNHFLELPGAPLDSFAVQFGPVTKENVAVTARIFGTAKGRRTPTFGVGLGGVAGFKLQVSPAKESIELLKDQELKQSAKFDWKSGSWTKLRLEIQQLKPGVWSVEGKAWPEGVPEPKEWMISFETPDEPIAGKASVLTSPFAGTPIRFDDLLVEKVPEH